MLQTIVLYWISLTGNAYEIAKHEGAEIYSSTPIVLCVGYETTSGSTKEKKSTYICLTERLFYNMTKIDRVKIIITGKYDA